MRWFWTLCYSAAAIAVVILIIEWMVKVIDNYPGGTP